MTRIAPRPAENRGGFRRHWRRACATGGGRLTPLGNCWDSEPAAGDQVVDSIWKPSLPRRNVPVSGTSVHCGGTPPAVTNCLKKVVALLQERSLKTFT